MPPLERVLLMKSDEMNRIAPYIACRRSGLDEQQATQHVRKTHPFFGDPREGDGDDRPLPIELKRRIVEYQERCGDLMERLKEVTSFNAFVRGEIRAGVL
jgi:hypothetical protein